jgi:hypothetical protein
LLICRIAALASELIPGCGASAARAAGINPIIAKANSTGAVLVYRIVMNLPPKMDAPSNASTCLNFERCAEVI